jgi:hypothetical protein
MKTLAILIVMGCSTIASLMGLIAFKPWIITARGVTDTRTKHNIEETLEMRKEIEKQLEEDTWWQVIKWNGFDEAKEYPEMWLENFKMTVEEDEQDEEDEQRGTDGDRDIKKGSEEIELAEEEEYEKDEEEEEEEDEEENGENDIGEELEKNEEEEEKEKLEEEQEKEDEEEKEEEEKDKEEEEKENEEKVDEKEDVEIGEREEEEEEEEWEKKEREKDEGEVVEEENIHHFYIRNESDEIGEIGDEERQMSPSSQMMSPSSQMPPSTSNCTCMNPFMGTNSRIIGVADLLCHRLGSCYVACTNAACMDMKPAWGKGRCYSYMACRTLLPGRPAHRPRPPKVLAWINALRRLMRM